jgi:hypothetical protein
VRWKSVIEVIGVMSIVASLIFVGLQIRQSTAIAMDAALASDTTIIIATEELVLENPDVWRRGCLGEPLDPTEQLVFTRLYHVNVIGYFLRWLRANSGVGSSDRSLPVDNVAKNIYRYPGFKHEWDTHGESRRSIPDGAPLEIFRRLVDERVAEYPSFEPEPIANVSRCGLN